MLPSENERLIMLGGLFGVISDDTFARDLFFGIDYHSHLGTEVGGLAFLDGDIHTISEDISNGQFKTYVQKHYERIKGRLGVGVISDINEEQPIKFESKIGTFALCTIGLIRNSLKLSAELIDRGVTLKKSKEKEGKKILNQTEIIGELICSGENLVDGIERMYKKIEGSISLLLLSKDDRSIYAVGDTFPLVIGVKENNWSIASETSAFPNLGYRLFKFLDYREIVSIGEKGPKTRAITPDEKKFCPFLHIYSGFPTSDYYGINAEIVRERCGGFIAENDNIEADLVLGIADSGFPHAVGYVKRKTELTKEKIEDYIEKFRQGKIGVDELTRKTKEICALNIPLRRSLIKYTPGWGRSYIPSTQKERELIAEYKQIPNAQLIEDKKIILVDDSIRRGTQLKDLLRDKVWPFKPKEIHGRIASPPQLYPCIFDLSTKRRDLATFKALGEIQEEKSATEYGDSKGIGGDEMIEEMRKMIGCTTLKFITLENMIKAVIEAPNNKGLKREDLCLYCWTGKF